MPSFIVRKPAITKDGSSLGPSMLMVTAPSAEAAKIDGANQLGCHPNQVIAEPYLDPAWEDLKNASS